MIRNLVLFLATSLPFLAQAQIDSNFKFNGQNAETLKKEQKVTVVTSTEVQGQGTCQREVEYTQNVCRNEQRTREECSWVPGRTECENRNEVECTNRPVSRQECSGGGTRTVCVERPTREVCRTDSRGQERCTTVGGGESCHEVNEPQVCRTVTDYEEDCRTVTRRVCEDIPGENVCVDRPYTERVCEDETRTRTENYSCTVTRTVVKTTPKTLKNEINVQFLTNGLVEEFQGIISVKEKGPDFKAFTMTAKLVKDPSILVFLKKKEVKIVSSTDKEIVLKSNVVFELLEKNFLPLDFPTIVESTFDLKSEKLRLLLDGNIAGSGDIDLTLSKVGKSFTSIIDEILNQYAKPGALEPVAQLADFFPGPKVAFVNEEEKIVMEVDLKGLIKGKIAASDVLKLKLKLNNEISVQGEIINTKKPDTSKLYEEISVKLK